MTMNHAVIKVLVVDDQQLIRQGIATLLELDDAIEIVGQAGSGREAISLVRTHKPDVILMDIRMPHMDGIETLKHIRKLFPDCVVLMLTTFSDDEFVIKSLQSGAHGYLLKDMPSEDLAQAIKTAHAGLFQLAPDVAGKLVGSLSVSSSLKPQASGENIPVTAREREVLRLLASGAMNREIAAELVVSEATVKKHIS